MKTKDRLYELLPVVHRQRDAAQGYPLRALLGVIGEQVAVIEEDIERLYDNWFIETCEDWVVPYLGDLLGYRAVAESGTAGDPRQAAGAALNRTLIPRREVANLIGARRRRGTLALLETLANDVAGWPARAVEFYRLLGWTQHLNHLRPDRARSVDVRHGAALARIGGPFDELARSTNVRRIGAARGPGRHNLPSVGVFVWRLRAFAVTRAPACRIEDRERRCYTFSILGNEAPLFTLPEAELEPTHIAGELNVPAPITRRALARVPAGHGGHRHARASTAYYGEGKSLVIYAPDWPKKGALQPLPATCIVPADLSARHYRPEPETVLVDPVRGLIEFPPRNGPGEVFVSYHYGFSAEIGGGEYARTLSEPAHSEFFRVGGAKTGAECLTIQEALERWEKMRAQLVTDKKPLSAVIEILDSRDYAESPRLALLAGESLQLRAASGARPVLRLLDRKVSGHDGLRISGACGSRVTLDGLLITGRGIQVCGLAENARKDGDLCDVTIRHCTLVPGWALECDCEPSDSSKPSLELLDSMAGVRLEHSIFGPVRVTANEVQADPLAFRVSDCIWDAMDENADALSGANDTHAHAALTLARSTVLGGVRTHEIVLAENSLFTGAVNVARRNRGCVRFCHVPAGHCTRTPRRYACQPDLVAQAVAAQVKAGKLPLAEAATATEREERRVRPHFNAVRYGQPAYAQLAETCAPEIQRGADDESEMGALHDLFQPQRAANLRARLEEFTPADAEAGVIFTT